MIEEASGEAAATVALVLLLTLGTADMLVAHLEVRLYFFNPSFLFYLDWSDASQQDRTKR